MSKIEIPISEEFSDEHGQFVNYDAYDTDQRAAVLSQEHADIRSFVQSDRGVYPGEGWTLSTNGGADTLLTTEVGPDAARNHWTLLQKTLVASTSYSFKSMMPDDDPVDLTVWDDGFISASLPGFPWTQLTQSSGQPLGGIKLHSPDGGEVTIPFANNMTDTSVATNNELRIDVSELVGNADWDPTQVTGVTIFFTTIVGASGTFKIAALRVLTPRWQYLPVDLDTRFGVLRRTVSLTGLTTTPYDVDLPIMWRANEPPGHTDPRPVDGSLAVTFNTGSRSTTNQVSVYYREVTKDFMTMQDLNGLEMEDLDGLPQPDIGEARWNPRPQSDLERYTQAELAEETQFSLERIPDYLAASWIIFLCQWNATGGTISIQNTEGNGYTFTLPVLATNTDYIFITELEGNGARARLYPLDGNGSIDLDNIIFDTTRIIDSSSFPRRQGRVGWFTQLLDGDAYIEGIRERGFTFAEHRLRPFSSLTPVEGAELFANFSANRELFTGVEPIGTTHTVTTDRAQARSDESYKIIDPGTDDLQGIFSNTVTITDFEQTAIRFETFIPQTALDAGVEFSVALFNTSTGDSTELLVGKFIGNQWQRHTIDLSHHQETLLTGSYRLRIWTTSVVPVTWWLDNVSIYERTIAWEGRAVVDDPWYSNDARWMDFKDNINKEHNGILFYKRGKDLQIRARALKQSSFITRNVKVRPKYAELGRLVWDEDIITSALPVANIAHSILGSTVSLNASASTDDNRIILYEWSFGDGHHDYGPVVSHTYASTGVYTVTLTVTDTNGQQSVATQEVGI